MSDAYQDVQTFVKTDKYKAGRREFLKSLGLSAVGAAVFGAAEGDFSAANAQTINDAAIVNFALNFEYLGASYYLYSVTGQGLSTSDTTAPGATPGTVSGGMQVRFQMPIVAALAMELAIDERNHVERLRSVLGSGAVAMPNINIGTAWTALAKTAGLPLTNGTFNPYANDYSFLLGAYVFEDVCVTALIGGAALLQSKANLAVLAGFLGVEAQQAGAIRTILFASGNQQLSNDTGAISATRSALANNGNPNADDIGIGTLTSPHLADTGAYGLSQARTTRQVLNIAYGSTSGSPGLFFPNGLNGTIR